MIVFLLTTACSTAPVASPTNVGAPPSHTSSPSNTPLPSNTPTLAPTSTLEPTATPSPNSTPTIIPTTIGGSEPKIAFTAKDKEGDLNLYIDDLFTGQPKIVTQIYLSEEDIISVVKWSPDGKKLAFGNGKENNERWLMVYDLATDAFQEVYKLPSGRYVDQIEWSADDNSLTFVTANLRPPGPNLATRRINLPDLIFLPVEGENLWINSETRVNSQAKCHDSRNPIVRRMEKAGYALWSICYFPDIGLYGGIKDVENGVDYDLISEDAQVQKTLIRFPAEFITGGVINLLLSPDGSRLLMIGVPSRPSGHDRENGIPFAIPVSMMDTSIATADAETLFYKEPVFKITPPPHVLTLVFVYGWSPDSRDYLVVRFYADTFYAANDTTPGEFVVVDADTGADVYTYQFPGDLQQIMSSGPGFDLVWPKP